MKYYKTQTILCTVSILFSFNSQCSPSVIITSSRGHVMYLRMTNENVVLTSNTG